MTRPDADGWASWRQPSAGLALLVAAPPLGLALVAWLIQRAVGA